MTRQNPIMDIINQGGNRASTSMSQAARTGGLAARSINRGASMALKLDQLLQEQEAKLANRAQQSQQNLNKVMQQRVDNNFKERQAKIAEAAEGRAQQLFPSQLQGAQLNNEAAAKRNDITGIQLNDAMRKEQFKESLASNLETYKSEVTEAERLYNANPENQAAYTNYIKTQNKYNYALENIAGVAPKTLDPVKAVNNLSSASLAKSQADVADKKVQSINDSQKYITANKDEMETIKNKFEAGKYKDYTTDQLFGVLADVQEYAYHDSIANQTNQSMYSGFANLLTEKIKQKYKGATTVKDVREAYMDIYKATIGKTKPNGLKYTDNEARETAVRVMMSVFPEAAKQMNLSGMNVSTSSAGNDSFLGNINNNPNEATAIINNIKSGNINKDNKTFVLGTINELDTDNGRAILSIDPSNPNIKDSNSKTAIENSQKMFVASLGNTDNDIRTAAVRTLESLPEGQQLAYTRMAIADSAKDGIEVKTADDGKHYMDASCNKGSFGCQKLNETLKQANQWYKYEDFERTSRALKSGGQGSVNAWLEDAFTNSQSKVDQARKKTKVDEKFVKQYSTAPYAVLNKATKFVADPGVFNKMANGFVNTHFLFGSGLKGTQSLAEYSDKVNMKVDGKDVDMPIAKIFFTNFDEMKAESVNKYKEIQGKRSKKYNPLASNFVSKEVADSQKDILADALKKAQSYTGKAADAIKYNIATLSSVVNQSVNANTGKIDGEDTSGINSSTTIPNVQFVGQDGKTYTLDLPLYQAYGLLSLLLKTQL